MPAPVPDDRLASRLAPGPAPARPRRRGARPHAPPGGTLGRAARAVAAAALATALAGCAALSGAKPEPPVVSVASVRPLNLSLSKQRLRFRLLVENPNGFDLPLEGLDFVATLGGDRVARGSSDEDVLIPANGSAEVSVDVVAGVDTVVDRIRAMVRNRTIDLDYTVAGTVDLANWPRPIPFDVEGIVDNPLRGGAPDDGDAPAGPDDSRGPDDGTDPTPTDGAGDPLVLRF